MSDTTQDAEHAAIYKEALERIADPRNTHFAGDARVVARAALDAAIRQAMVDDAAGVREEPHG